MKRGRNSKEALALAAAVIVADRSPRWFRALTDPTPVARGEFEQIAMMKDEYDELIAAARAVVDEECQGYCEDEPHPWGNLERLRRAIP